MGRGLQTYEAPGVTVTYDPAICIHAAECVRSLPHVFDPREKRWIRPERATPEEIDAAVARCPSGALRSIRPGPDSAPRTGQEAVLQEMTVIQLRQHGPLAVSGPMRIETDDGQILFEGRKATLCRCGGTGNAPFCDGSHARRNFRSAR